MTARIKKGMATGMLTTMAIGLLAWAGTQIQNIPVIHQKVKYIEKDRLELREEIQIMRKEIRTDINGVRKVLGEIQKDMRKN